MRGSTEVPRKLRQRNSVSVVFDWSSHRCHLRCLSVLSSRTAPLSPCLSSSSVSQLQYAPPAWGMTGRACTTILPLFCLLSPAGAGYRWMLRLAASAQSGISATIKREQRHQTLTVQSSGEFGAVFVSPYSVSEIV